MPPHARHSATSRAAAESVEHVLNERQRMVLDCLRAHPDGLTTDAIEVLTGMSHQGCSPRVIELAKAGLIRPDGERKTRSGRNAAVWKIATVSRADQLELL